ncbi:MAG: hypothetical protein ACFFBD_05995 [Candidatus Hodarchaeota archaeon]
MDLKKTLLGGLFLFALLSILAISASATPRATFSENLIVSVSIVDAFYDDLDDDGFMDDIQIDVLLDFIAADDLPKLIRLTLAMEMILPSGLSYEFAVEVWVSPSSDRHLIITLWNTATESGWYTVNLQGFVRGTGDGAFSLQDSLIFDPPTGQGSGNPSIRVLIV